jgi:hypothetical protein
LLKQNFEVLKPGSLADRAEYDDLLGESIYPSCGRQFEAQDNSNLTARCRLLALSGKTGMVLSGAVLSGSAGGKGSSIDISTQSPILIGSGSSDSDQVVLNAQRLQSWGASSLLIGGLRRLTPDGTVVDVQTNSLTMDGASLSGGEIILASKKDILLTSGASIQAVGDIGSDASPISIDGQGAFVRVSSNAQAAFKRTGTIVENDAALTIDPGVSLTGSSIILDSTNAATLAPEANLQTQNLFLGSGRIAVDFSGTSGVSNALVLSGDLLNQLASLNGLTLSSYSSIDFYDAGTLGSNSLKSLTLKAAGITGGTGDTTLKASTIHLSNPLSAEAPIAPLASGKLRLESEKIELGQGTFSLVGFESTEAMATGGVVVTGSGALLSDGDLTFQAPAFASNRLTQYAVTSQGKLQLDSSSTTPIVASEPGARPVPHWHRGPSEFPYLTPRWRTQSSCHPKAT